MRHFKLKRFYTPRHNLRPGSSVLIEEAEALHIKQSLRMSPGDQIILFNGESEFIAELGLVTKDAVMANILEKLSDQVVSNTGKITLAQALIKISNFELVLEKCSELGAAAFLPLNTEFSQQSEKIFTAKQSRFEKIILSACKQSERVSIPALLPVEKLTSENISVWLKEYDLVIVATLARQSVNTSSVKQLSELQDRIENATKVLLLIGPEGGFSPTEHQLFESLPELQMLELFGGMILRAETAAIAGLAALQAI